MKLLKKILPKKIDQLVYFINDKVLLPELNIEFDENILKIETFNKKSSSIYNLLINGNLAHSSVVYKKTHLLKTIGKYKSPVIGNCFTKENFRGNSIYPYMIKKIGIEALKKNKEIYILVSPKNHSSIRGIEKAGYNYYGRIKTTRIGVFYFNKKLYLGEK